VLMNIVLIYAEESVIAGGSAPANAVKRKGDFEEENYEVKYASKCEVCKIVTGEVEYQLNSKFNSPEVIQTGYNYMQDGKNNKKTQYGKSMIRLQEAVESTCGALLEYNIHKERSDVTRFARGQSQTFKTLHGLKNKGVKVDLGMPDEMWDKPSAEITQLKSQCETFLESNEEEIENWYQDAAETPLEQFICKKTLKKKEQGCLAATPVPVLKESSVDDKKTKTEPKTEL